MNDTTKFNVEWRSTTSYGGHYVFINDYTWHLAIFVDENEAEDYAAYRQRLFDEKGTSEIEMRLEETMTTEVSTK